MAANKSHLDIEHGNFRDVAGRGAHFSAEGRCDFKHPLKDADHDLLVKLRALGQRGFLAEVIELKDFGAALGRSGHQLWRVNFYKVVFVQKFTDITSQL